MPVTVTKIKDTGKEAAILVTGSFTSANTSNIRLLAANSLFAANTSLSAAAGRCRLAVSLIDYHTAIKSAGWIELQWEGDTNTPSDNTTFFVSGGQVGGDFGGNKGGIVIPHFTSANSANSYGNINLLTSSLANGDTFSLIINLKKVQGYANSANGYNPTVRTP